jgi:uncharacterized membrane protein YeaQ/YmgE (transglycosylase-associated protein family)
VCDREVRQPRAISAWPQLAGPQRGIAHALLGTSANECDDGSRPAAERRSKMGIVSWIVVGAIAGILAGFFVTGDEGLGIIGRILLGIVGAVVGGFVAGALTGGDYLTGINLTTIIVATIGAVIVVVLYNLFTSRSSTGRGVV